MKFGRYQISFPNHGSFRLDGGSMFGSVPKKLWSKMMLCDDENCIKLATRSLLLEDDTRKILVDVGNGVKGSEKFKKIFAIENNPDPGFTKSEITDVVLTHLHFDHAGGLSYFNGNGELELSYPQAIHYLQEDNFKTAKDPNLREKASYLPDHVDILDQARLRLLSGSKEIFPNIFVHQVNGHTRGQQYIEVRSDNDRLYFPTDLIPTSHHLPIPYNMGYDICAETIMKEKTAFLEKALSEDALIVFQHDPDVAACRICKNEKGHFAVREVVDLAVLLE